MANASAIQNVIDLKSELITSKNKNTITPFIGFKKRNSPYLNDSLKALTENKNVEASTFDNEGNAYVWREETGEFLINGELKRVVDKRHPIEEDITPDIRDPLNRQPYKCWYVGYGFWIYMTLNPAANIYNVFCRDREFNPYLGDHLVGNFKISEDFLSTSFSVYRNICCLFVNNTFFYWKVTEDVTQFFQNIKTVTVDFNIAFDKISSIENGEIIINEKTYCYFFLRNNKGDDNPCGIIVDPVTGEIVHIVSDDTVQGIFYAYEGNIFYITLTLPNKDSYEIAKKLVFTVDETGIKTSYDTISFGPRPTTSYQELAKTTYKSLFVHGVFFKLAIASGRAAVSSKYEFQHFTGYAINSQEAKFPGQGYFTGEDSSPVINTILPVEKTNNGYFCVLINGGEASGISYVLKEGTGTLCTEWLSISTDNFKPYFLIENERHTLIFEDKYRKIKKLSIVEDDLKVQILDNKYVLFSSVDSANCYDIEKKEFTHWASDWNNRYTFPYYNFGYPSIDSYLKNIEVGGGRVDYINIKNPVVTAIFNPVLCRVYEPNHSSNRSQMDLLPDYKKEIDVYIGENTVPEYYVSYNLESGVEKYFNYILLNTLYPIATDGNPVLNPSVQMKLTETNYQMNYLKDSKDIYSLVYNNGHSILAYGYGTQLSELSSLFILQGQAYIIRNNIINSVVIENNLLQNITPIISCNGFEFLGASLSYAYFWSKADKHIYIFSGNREFSKTSDMSEINEIINSAYNINTNSFFLIANNKVYVSVNDEYIYTINGKYKDIKFFDKGFALEIDTNNWDVFSYYGGSNRPIELETAFYGAGSNKLSVIDCWYLRLYSDEPKAGNVTCSIVTLTNKGEVTDSYTFHLTAELWDKETNTYYLRYQPKNQRSIGTTLRVKSDFDIIDLQCSVFPDNAVQISNPVVKTYQSGAKI